MSNDTTRDEFLSEINSLRPQLHRYCSRMTGSLADGEDLVQESLAQAFFKLHMFRAGLSMKAWLFRIAHNKCIDFLRQRGRLREVETSMDYEQGYDDQAVELLDEASAAVGHLLTQLPARQRACVILKDVLGFTLEETANALSLTVASVKSSLHRGRGRLSRSSSRQQPQQQAPQQHKQLLSRYIQLFNARDWDGVKAMLHEDIYGEVSEAAAVMNKDTFVSRYFTNYNSQSRPWRLSLEWALQEWLVVRWVQHDDGWRPVSVAAMDTDGDQITRIRDYFHTGYIIDELRQLTPDTLQA